MISLQIRNALVFMPDDPNNLHQVCPQRHIEGLNVPRIQGYRYPAPGSRFGAKVPTRDNSDEIYDTNFAPKDSRNLPTGVSFPPMSPLLLLSLLLLFRAPHLILFIVLKLSFITWLFITVFVPHSPYLFRVYTVPSLNGHSCELNN